MLRATALRGGPGWSLRGNGALIVPFAGGPGILGGCWGALPALASAPSRRFGWTTGWVAACLLLVPLCGMLGYVLAAVLVSTFAAQR